jgi:hypothetical protein
VKKELRPVHDEMACDVCGRTILKGERTETYLAPAGERKLVCELCGTRALHAGWIRESAHGDMPAAHRPKEARRSLLSRLRRGREAEPVAEEADAPAPEAGEHPEEAIAQGAEEPEERPVSRPKDPRHVRAIPTNAEVKVERALELFNDSEHRRTIAGIARTLGGPWVSASPDPVASSEVNVVVAWELSWYRYRVDLGDADEPVALVEKGQELAELPEELREWNGSASVDGVLAAGVGSGR